MPSFDIRQSHVISRISSKALFICTVLKASFLYVYGRLTAVSFEYAGSICGADDEVIGIMQGEPRSNGQM